MLARRQQEEGRAPGPIALFDAFSVLDSVLWLSPWLLVSKLTYLLTYFGCSPAQGCTRCGTLNRDARHPACTQVPVQPVALAPKCRCRMVQSRALHLRCKVQLGASAPHLGACTIRSPVARGRPNVYSSTGNWKCALQFERRCSQCVWMGWSPSRKLMHAIGKSFWKPRHIALSDQTGSETKIQEPHITGTRARGLSRALLITH